MDLKRCAVVLVVKDEVDDLPCWLAWYHIQGFDTCIVFDDDSTDGTWETLQQAALVQDIRLSRTVGPRDIYYYERQQICYRHAIEQYRDEFEWIAFLDADEYISFRNGANLPDFLSGFEDADGIVINWCNYGSSNHALKPKLLPVEAYTWHGDAQQPINRHVKSIVRPKKIGAKWQNVHCFDIDLSRYFDASHNRFEWGITPGILNKAPDWSVGKIMHFQCRSMEHFIERLRKRRELSPSVEMWTKYDVNQLEDRAPVRFVPELQNQIAKLAGSLDNVAVVPPPLSLVASLPLRSMPLNLSHHDLIAKLWRGQDPFHGFPRNLYASDIQGWGSAHNFLVDSHETLRPNVIVEIGVWKGGSTIAMASKLREYGIDGVVVAVDTWLGAWDHWIDDAWFAHLGWDHGYPSISRKFMNNVVDAGLQEQVVPLPLDSLNAAQVLKHFKVQPDIIHLDGAHDFESVIADLRAWWPLLRPGGLLIGDDYYEHTHWPGVKQAFDTFFSPARPSPLENAYGKCRVYKGLTE